MILIGEALAKSVVLARHEREVASVFDTTEPFARELAQSGRMRGGRAAILKHIGNALSVRHRVTGPVEVSEKPDILWDKPHLERLYTRLADEYELKERAESLNRKLGVIAETAQVLTDIIDTRRSLRLRTDHRVPDPVRGDHHFVSARPARLKRRPDFGPSHHVRHTADPKIGLNRRAVLALPSGTKFKGTLQGG